MKDKTKFIRKKCLKIMGNNAALFKELRELDKLLPFQKKETPQVGCMVINYKLFKLDKLITESDILDWGAYDDCLNMSQELTDLIMTRKLHQGLQHCDTNVNLKPEDFITK